MNDIDECQIFWKSKFLEIKTRRQNYLKKYLFITQNIENHSKQSSTMEGSTEQVKHKTEC